MSIDAPGPDVPQAQESSQAAARPTISTETLGHNTPEVATWPTYRKRVATRAIKILGPFLVETSEGPMVCQDGYLAVDARGYPYPIATEEFELIYTLETYADVHGSERTVKEFVDAAIAELLQLRANAADGDQAREYSIAITALEDAKMRTTRGLAKSLGVFNEVDLQQQAGIDRAQANHAANVAGNAEDGITRSAPVPA